MLPSEHQRSERPFPMGSPRALESIGSDWRIPIQRDYAFRALLDRSLKAVTDAVSAGHLVTNNQAGPRRPGHGAFRSRKCSCRCCLLWLYWRTWRPAGDAGLARARWRKRSTRWPPRAIWPPVVANFAGDASQLRCRWWVGDGCFAHRFRTALHERHGDSLGASRTCWSTSSCASCPAGSHQARQTTSAFSDSDSMQGTLGHGLDSDCVAGHGNRAIEESGMMLMDRRMQTRGLPEVIRSDNGKVGGVEEVRLPQKLLIVAHKRHRSKQK